MIFYFVGIIMMVIGLIYMVYPSKKRTYKYGYRTPRARHSDATFQYAQRVASHIFLIVGGVTFLIGLLLKKTGNVQFFILELFLVAIPIISVFYLIERRLEIFNDDLDSHINNVVKEKSNEVTND